MRAPVVWVGVEVPGPGYPQKVQPNEVEVFATEHAARTWQFENKITASSPLRELYKRRVRPVQPPNPDAPTEPSGRPSRGQSNSSL